VNRPLSGGRKRHGALTYPRGAPSAESPSSLLRAMFTDGKGSVALVRTRPRPVLVDLKSQLASCESQSCFRALAEGDEKELPAVG
jgi:hypothetical protein